MNKVSLVTLWIEPTAHQMVQYTFNNVDLDFLRPHGSSTSTTSRRR